VSYIRFVLTELWATLVDTWEQGDLGGHLRAWWWVVTYPELLGDEEA
jgi:hypothetical protein